MDRGEGRREKHLKRSYGQMDRLFAVALNRSMKAEKMTICHLKPLGVPLVLEKAIRSVCVGCERIRIELKLCTHSHTLSINETVMIFG